MGTRRERVVLELDDQFTTSAARAAAASALLDKSLDRTSKSSDRAGASLTGTDRDVNRLSGTVTRSTRDLDSYSGRLGLLASSIGAVGPAAIPIVGIAIPAVTGLASSLGFAAVAGGTAILAFQGVGDALDAMNKAHLEPTEANLEKAREAMRRLSPDAQQLILKLQSMRGEFRELREASGSGIFPGANAALDAFETRLPIVEKILRRISGAAGDALREGGESLAGPEWDDFFHFIATEARPELTKFARTVGNLAHGFAELWVAFGPLNSTFSSWLLDSARGFDDWATGLSATQGFQEFITYLRENGPLVGDAVGAIATALLQIVEAAAPLGGPVLEGITAIANIIAEIADSDLGTPIFGLISALSIASLATKAFEGVTASAAGKFVAGQVKAGLAIKATTSLIETQGVATKAVAEANTAAAASQAAAAGSWRTLASGAARAGFAGLAFSGLAEDIGLAGTAMGGLVAGPWGAGAGLLYDVATSGNAAGDALERLQKVVDSGDFSGINTELAATTAEIDKQKNSIGGYFKLALQGIDVNSRSGWNFDSTGLGKQLELRNQLEQEAGDLRLGVQTIGQLNGISAGPGQATSLEDLTKVLQKAKPALDDLGISMDDIAQAARDGSIIEMGKQIDAWLKDPLNRAKLSADQFKMSIESAFAALSKRASKRDFEAALDAATAALKENGRTLDIRTAKGRENQAALDNIANTALKVAENLEGMDRVRYLRQARQDFVDIGIQMGLSREEARKLADRLIQTGKIKVKPKIDVDTTSADRQISTFEQRLQGLTGKQRTVYINTVNRSIFGAPNPKNPQPGSGDGFGVVAPRHDALGGHVTGAGTKTSDSIPAWLSNGEFVVQAEAVDRYGVGFMNDVNAMRLAGGGYATRNLPGRSGASHITVDIGDLRVVGTLKTPWGPAQVEGIARAAARDEISDAAALDHSHDSMFTGGDRG